MRFYNGGEIDAATYARDALTDDESAKLKLQAVLHHKLGRPHRDAMVAKAGKQFVKRPPIFCSIDQSTGKHIETLDEWEPGAVCIGILGQGFKVVKLGEYVDISDVTVEAVKDLAPHLLTEEEWFSRVAASPVVEDVQPSESPSSKKSKG